MSLFLESSYGSSNQQGAALLISLVILIIITLIGIASIQTTTLQQKMAGNLRLSNIAFQGAEAALGQAESRLEQQGAGRERPYQSLISDPKSKAGGGKKDLNVWGQNTPAAGAAVAWWSVADNKWWRDSAKNDSTYSFDFPMGDLDKKQRPLYVIEQLPRDPPPESSNTEDYLRYTDYNDFHRITARATAGDNQSFIMLQSTHRWEFNR